MIHPHSWLRRAFAALACASSLGVAAPAWAYCRTAVCGEEVGKVCNPAQSNDCGTPIFWPTSCVGFSVQRDASSDVDFDTATELTEQAFAAWSNADCGDGTPSITATNLGPVSCSEQTFDAETRNSNTIIFRDDDWPYGPGALALTTVTYALDTGEIRDADIELNSDDATFTTGDSDVNVDLLSILTHETGHFLGLAHTDVDGATMQTDYPPKSTTLRNLEQDDVDAICAVYPPDREAACTPDPVNGLGDECDEDPEGSESGCDCTSAGMPSDGLGGWLAVGMVTALAALSHVRRSRGRPRTLA
ncbi:MAG: matrixin family metalloprotease [Polyangiaceae bacterium]|nr:matrixin family metalloprotease [Polyangiaceae bacterium]